MADASRPAPKRSARKALNATNLAALGPERLADLLMELADAQPATKRRLRLELAGEASAEDLAAQIQKRFDTIEARRSRVHWRKYKEFVRDLEQQRAMIAGRLAELDPGIAHDAMWRLVGLAPRLFAQVDDRKGLLDELMREAVQDLGRLAAAARPDAGRLAERVYEALRTDSAGVLDDLGAVLAPSLGDAGADALVGLIGGSAERLSRVRESFRLALQQIADHRGDVDGWIAATPERLREEPGAAAAIAARLLDAGRTAEAVDALDRAAPRLARAPLEERQAWEGAFMDALEAAGRSEEAQRMRWAAFERDLSAERLREYLRRLPDFDDVEAEERALSYVAGHPRFGAALAFLMDWPALPRAAALIAGRSPEIVVQDAAVAHDHVRRLESRHPLAASLLLRAMVVHAARRLDRAGAERLLQEAGSLAEQVEDFSPHESHAAFEERVRRTSRL